MSVIFGERPLKVYKNVRPGANYPIPFLYEDTDDVKHTFLKTATGELDTRLASAVTHVKANTGSAYWNSFVTLSLVGGQAAFDYERDGVDLVIYRDTARTQNISFDDPDMERALDKLTRITQELDSRIINAVKLRKNTTADGRVTGRNGYIGIREDGSPLLASDTDLSPIEWNATINYAQGAVVKYGGFLWQRTFVPGPVGTIPEVPSIFWAQLYPVTDDIVHTLTSIMVELGDNKVQLAFASDSSLMTARIFARAGRDATEYVIDGDDWTVEGNGKGGILFDPRTPPITFRCRNIVLRNINLIFRGQSNDERIGLIFGAEGDGGAGDDTKGCSRVVLENIGIYGVGLGDEGGIRKIDLIKAIEVKSGAHGAVAITNLFREELS